MKRRIETQNANDCFDPEEIAYVEVNGYSGMEGRIGTQLVEARDYRGKEVLATHAYIPETGWCLITKVDKGDVMSFRIILTVINSAVLLLSLILFALIGFIISRRITRPIQTLQAGVEKVTKGDFDLNIEQNSKDELGQLAQAFNDMSLAIKQSRADIEEKVESQTREIKNKAGQLEEQKKAIMNILEDVQASKKKTEELADNLKKFKLALENASDQVVITDAEGIVIYGNPAVETITGYKPEEAMGKKAAALWKMPMPIEYYKKMWSRIKIQKKTFTDEIQNRRKNGEIYIANISISPVLNERGEVIYFVAIEHDITKEKEVDKAKTEFVSLASHQLRTPLSSINWYTEMLLNGDAGNINEEQKKYLTEVYAGSQRMVELVNSLLNVSRLDLGTFIIDPVPVEVTKTVKSLLEELRPQINCKKQTIKEIYGADLPPLLADQNLLRMILQNLLSNAVKYTPVGGLITVEIQVADAEYQIRVSDTGMGIPKRQQDKVFLKLFRADNAKQSETEGTGLGLYIIKSIVDQAGGEVWFESEENKGTTFHISFPSSGMKKKEGKRPLD
jgi:PAS domain S-box-containing protein